MSCVALAKQGITIAGKWGYTRNAPTLPESMVVKHVYLLESLSQPGRRYVGCTTDLERRLADHNAGKSPHTSKYRPWSVRVAVSFSDHGRAEAFERYLKHGSGHAFANRHFW